ncbi:NAD(P)-dependent alcohol dehydrogenase [Altererythrobacter sp. GH1-8]|uniref:NAD(P)-dependent alcohol dehydrogenase n=1 Tax=Altererythrobacter sp. GH1-8 TaxID=3349333 RepID=UPI00374DA3CF
MIETLVLDDPAPDEVVIKLEAAGICHTDLGISQWSDSPRVFGHEGAGVVVEIGAAITRFAKGDRVIATFGSCGACPNCEGGRPAYCFDGIALNIDGKRSADRPSLTREDGSAVGGAFFQQSSFATHALTTERNLVKIPDGLDMTIAAPLGCGIQTGAGAVFNQIGAKAGRPLLVVGAGAVGLAAIMAGKIVGCEPIIAVELNEDRRALARELGATLALDGADPDWTEQVIAITKGGATAALDTAGTQATFEASLAALHSGGSLGVLTLPGEFGAPIAHPGGLDFMTKTIVGIIEGDSVPVDFLPLLIAHYAAGNLPVDRLVKTFPFEQIAEAFADAASGTAIKPVLIFEEIEP